MQAAIACRTKNRRRLDTGRRKSIKSDSSGEYTQLSMKSLHTFKDFQIEPDIEYMKLTEDHTEEAVKLVIYSLHEHLLFRLVGVTLEALYLDLYAILKEIAYEHLSFIAFDNDKKKVVACLLLEKEQSTKCTGLISSGTRIRDEKLKTVYSLVSEIYGKSGRLENTGVRCRALAVHPSYNHLGIRSAILITALQHLQGRYLSTVTVLQEETYAKQGFKVVSEQVLTTYNSWRSSKPQGIPIKLMVYTVS